jgi:hypothetical protein
VVVYVPCTTVRPCVQRSRRSCVDRITQHRRRSELIGALVTDHFSCFYFSSFLAVRQVRIEWNQSFSGSFLCISSLVRRIDSRFVWQSSRIYKVWPIIFVDGIDPRVILIGSGPAGFPVEMHGERSCWKLLPEVQHFVISVPTPERIHSRRSEAKRLVFVVIARQSQPSKDFLTCCCCCFVPSRNAVV